MHASTYTRHVVLQCCMPRHRGGLNFREGNYVCEALFATGRLRSMDLVEVRIKACVLCVAI